MIGAGFVAIGALSRADPAPMVHYAPAENLEHIDVSLIDTAKYEIDFAAYVLTLTIWRPPSVCSISFGPTNPIF
jgi:hypothetical protein